MYAVIRTGGKQYKVAEGDVLDLELMSDLKEDAKEATLSDVLLVGDGDTITVGGKTYVSVETPAATIGVFVNTEPDA